MTGFTITARFITGRADAHRPGLTPEVAWPPDPWRLLCALVAAAGSERSATEGAALTWLESQPNPIILADPEIAVGDETAYRPSADEQKWANMAAFDQRGVLVKRALDPRSSIMPRTPVVGFRWPTDPPTPLRRALHGLAADVTHLGRASARVIVTIGGECNLPEWTPGAEPRTGIGVRLPRPGSLAALDRAYAEGLRAWAVQPAPTLYTPPYAKQRPLSGPWDPEMVVWRLGRRFPATHALTLTNALRAVWLQKLGDDAPDELVGHDRGEVHPAFLPLIDAGHEHATGDILGLAIAAPADLRPDLAVRHRAALAALAGGFVMQGVQMKPDAGRTWSLRPSRWADPSHQWASVLPVIPSRWWRKPDAVPNMIAQAAELVTGQRPEHVACHPVCPLTGPGRITPADLARKEPVPRPAWVTVQFAEPISGPLAIGRNRHFGAGLLAPLAPGQ